MVSTQICGVQCLHPTAVAKARAALEQARTESLAEIFRALADPTRVGILTALSAGELCVCDLADLFGVTPGAISHQLRLLKGARLVRPRREGKIVFYRLDDDHVARLFAEAAGHAAETSR
jgi:DNA-binding transcriptional ArsR family regulator